MYGYVNCPQCGVKANLRESSVGTVRRCQNCGHRFIAQPPKATPTGCVAGLLLLFAGGAGIAACCGLLGVIGAATPSIPPPPRPVEAENLIAAAPNTDDANALQVDNLAETSDVAMKEAAQEFLRAHLTDLLKIKELPSFATYGFGTGGPHYHWLIEVQAACDDAPPGTERIAMGDLLQLGLRYASNPQEDSDYTRFAIKQIETIIGEPPIQDLPREATAKFRKWTSAGGNFAIEAEFLSYANGKLKLRKPDGTELTVELDKLSQADHDWIEEYRRSK